MGTVGIFGSEVAGVGGGGPDAAIAAKACTGVVGGRENRGGGGPFGLDFAAAGEEVATALGGVPRHQSLTWLVSVGRPSAREISSESLVCMSWMGSEDDELSLLEGLDPRERAGLVEEEGARVVVLLFICTLFRPAELCRVRSMLSSRRCCSFFREKFSAA